MRYRDNRRIQQTKKRNDEISTSPALTGHEMQQQRRDRIQRGTVGDVRTRVRQHGDDAIGDGASLARQMIGQAVRRVNERRQHDRLLR